MLNRFLLPGSGLPLDFEPETDTSDTSIGSEGPLFKNALCCSESEWNAGCNSLRLTTLREFTMMQFMNQLTEKPNWEEKVFNDEIIAKWTTEALGIEGIDITLKMVEWCIAELQYKAKDFKRTGAVSVYNGDVVKSDCAISASLNKALQAAVKRLEDIPASLKDWHPGSDGKVLDLVHPSLFPLIYNRSKIINKGVVELKNCVRRSGEGDVLPVPECDDYRYSNTFQWLPCDVELGGDENSVKITSYINNLHPGKHKDLYNIIEQIITRAIPLWNMSLTPLKTPGYYYARILYNEAVYDPDPQEWPESQHPLKEEGEDEDTYGERLYTWFSQIRRPVLPEPSRFHPPAMTYTGFDFSSVADLKSRNEKLNADYLDLKTGALKYEHTVDLRRRFRKSGLQVIVKLANIELTPEKPVYKGGTWHVEGQMNEHICASALYYYSSANITSSSLAFRQRSNPEDSDFPKIRYRQDNHEWLEAVFGCENYGTSIQYIGDVQTIEGRLLTFPNILQHKVGSFQLADPSKPGHRKILALFLVDPNIRIISTANIPPQQRHWWGEELQVSSCISALPREISDEIIDYVDGFPISTEEAKELRLRLMEERSVFVLENNKLLETETFSLCEH